MEQLARYWFEFERHYLLWIGRNWQIETTSVGWFHQQRRCVVSARRCIGI